MGAGAVVLAVGVGGPVGASSPLGAAGVCPGRWCRWVMRWRSLLGGVAGRGRRAYVPVAASQPVAVGDGVRTDATGFAEVAYGDGSRTRLDVNTEFEVVAVGR